jgi:hypothetical protein
VKKVLTAFALAALLAVSPSAVGRALPATDNFNRTEDPLAGNWTQTGPGGTEMASDVSSGQAFPRAGASRSAIRWNADTFGAAHYSEATLAVYNSSFYGGVTVRHQSGADTYYTFSGEAGTYEIGRVDAGTYQTITGSLGTPAATDLLKLEVSGTTLTAYVDGVSAGTGATTTGGAAITGGGAGLMGYGSAATVAFDNWTGDDIGGVTTCPVCAKVNSPIRGGGLRVFLRF